MEIPYVPYNKSVIIHLLEFVKLQNCQKEASLNTYDTNRICCCFLESIGESIRAALVVLESRNNLATSILSRSILEQVVDLRYIAENDNISLNKRFVNRHKLLNYWERNELLFSKDNVPAIESEYQAHVIEDYFKEFKTASSRKSDNNDSEVIVWSRFDKFIRDKYHKHWSGMNLPERVNTLKLPTEYASYYKHVSENYEDGMIMFARKFWKYYSRYTHTTPYSMLPCFVPQSNEYEIKHNPSDKLLLMHDQFLQVALLSAIAAYAISLGGEGHKDLLDGLEVYIREKCPEYLTRELSK